MTYERPTHVNPSPKARLRRATYSKLTANGRAERAELALRLRAIRRRLAQETMPFYRRPFHGRQLMAQQIEGEWRSGGIALGRTMLVYSKDGRLIDVNPIG